MGAGGPADDFPNSSWLGDRLRRYLAPPYDQLHLELVFNGDTFDLLKTSFNNAWPHHITAEVASTKMARVAEAHPEFFAALRDILAARGGDVSIHFVAGNHDLELFFPEVQAVIRDLTTVDERVRFHGHELELGRVRIEHGSQLDPLFRVEPEQAFLEFNGQKILNLSWASVALLDVAIPLQPLLHHLDRLKPKNLVLDLLPEVRELLTGLAWTYWTREYWRDFFGSKNPLKRVSWTMFKEVVWRFVAREIEVAMEDTFAKILKDRDDIDLSIVGHQHEPGWWSFGDRKALRTGALRDEFMLSDGGYVQTPINKTWAEAFLAGDTVVRSHLVEEPSPMRPPGTMMTSIFDVVPGVLARLASPDARAGLDDEAQKKQAALESSERTKG